MNHKGTITLETNRLILRRFRLDDAQAMYDNWASDPEVTKFLTWPIHGNVEISRSILQSWIDAYADNDTYQWAIVLKENGDFPIGSIAVVHQQEDINMVHIGYCIGRSWWHQGITSEALAEIIRFFMEEVGANRVECRHDSNNPNSGKVMAKCGMKPEGILRQADRNNQGICDCCMYGILAPGLFSKQIEIRK